MADKNECANQEFGCNKKPKPRNEEMKKPEVAFRNTYERLKYQATQRAWRPDELPNPICNQYLFDLFEEIDRLRERVRDLEKGK